MNTYRDSIMTNIDCSHCYFTFVLQLRNIDDTCYANDFGKTVATSERDTTGKCNTIFKGFEGIKFTCEVMSYALIVLIDIPLFTFWIDMNMIY